MEQLLAFHGIQLVSIGLENDETRQFAFTKKMAANNIFIEFRIEPEDDYVDEESDVEDDQETEYGSRLSVLVKQGGDYYEFLMFYNTIDLKIPILLAQTIVFLANICDKNGADELIEILLEVCPDPLIPKDIEDEEHRNAANALISMKMDLVTRIIHELKAGQN